MSNDLEQFSVERLKELIGNTEYHI